MKLAQLSSRTLAVSALLSVSASPALAGTCTTNNRALPANLGTDSVTMTCDSSTGAITTGLNSIQNINGAFTLFANFIQGAAGQFARAQVLNAAGSVVCTVTDVGAAGGPNVASCGVVAGVTWRGSIAHQN